MAKILMYSKVPCPYCNAAKSFLKGKGLEFQEKDLTDQPQEMLRLKEETGWRTFPMIFINDKMIGGYQDLKALDDSGELDRLLS